MLQSYKLFRNINHLFGNYSYICTQKRAKLGCASAIVTRSIAFGLQQDAEPVEIPSITRSDALQPTFECFAASIRMLPFPYKEASG